SDAGLVDDGTLTGHGTLLSPGTLTGRGTLAAHVVWMLVGHFAPPGPACGEFTTLRGCCPVAMAMTSPRISAAVLSVKSWVQHSECGASTTFSSPIRGCRRAAARPRTRPGRLQRWCPPAAL